MHSEIERAAIAFVEARAKQRQRREELQTSNGGVSVGYVTLMQDAERQADALEAAVLAAMTDDAKHDAVRAGMDARKAAVTGDSPSVKFARVWDGGTIAP